MDLALYDVLAGAVLLSALTVVAVMIFALFLFGTTPTSFSLPFEAFASLGALLKGTDFLATCFGLFEAKLVGAGDRETGMFSFFFSGAVLLGVGLAFFVTG